MNYHINELFYLLRSSDHEVARYVYKVLDKLNYKLVYDPDPNAGYVLAIPRGPCTPTLLCAHMDTVRSKQDVSVELVRMGTTIQNRKGVLGADDRAGVGILLNIARKFKQLPYLLFTMGEERGFLGMRKFIKDKVLDKYIEDIYAFVQYDRRGHNELVVYNQRVPKSLISLFELVGYEEERGKSSDVKMLSEQYGIAHVNLSAGFYCEHTDDEFLNIFSYQNAISAACDILPCIRKVYMLDPPPVNTATTYSGSGHQYASAYHPNPPERVCKCCGNVTYAGQWHSLAQGYLCLSCEEKIKSESVTGQVTIVAFQSYKKKKEKSKSILNKFKAAREGRYLKDVPGLNSCPVCGKMENVEFRKNKADFFCHSCNTQFSVDRCEKIAYLLDKDLGKYVKHTVKARPSPAVKPIFIPKYCTSCESGNVNKLYWVLVSEGPKKWVCKDCLDNMLRDEVISNKTYINTLKEGYKLPF